MGIKGVERSDSVDTSTHGSAMIARDASGVGTTRLEGPMLVCLYVLHDMRARHRPILPSHTMVRSMNLLHVSNEERLGEFNPI